jgi:hypothetical protein
MEHITGPAFHFWSEFISWNPPDLTMRIMLLIGALSAWVITRFVVAPPLMVAPVSFIALTFAAMISNFTGRSHMVMGISDLQRAIICTVIGHAVAAIVLLAIFRVGGKKFAR